MVTLYGISNCDTVKKAKSWLMLHGIDFIFHDYKRMGITAKKLQDWCKKFGWDKVLNKNDMTYKKLQEGEKQVILNQASAITYMLKATSSIKRPIVETSNGLLLGFVPNDYENMFL
ncbi:MAG: Spx/MgsR family RNA polymerase-binding regulatory protein [Sphingobacteriales bacterium]|nr:MAG: Spx/MgsR family RNA polymerase-binding regulatory protein [Sphingobacteriales bacterium]TAF82437.1 MAG: Spx/MgsR family RNA polymerase-binding regulatory protein [Sphingobacteriales bacterium]